MKKKNRYTMRNSFNEVMKKFYREPETVQEAVDHIMPHRWLLEQLYDRAIEEDIRLNREFSEEFGVPESPPDTRSGEETYGYESDSSILGHLVCISDRWCAPFRLRWLIDLLDRYPEESVPTCPECGEPECLCLLKP